MEFLATRAVEVAELARKFRSRAQEAGDPFYRAMMLRTADELEEHASRLERENRPRPRQFDGLATDTND